MGDILRPGEPDCGEGTIVLDRSSQQLIDESTVVVERSTLPVAHDTIEQDVEQDVEQGAENAPSRAVLASGAGALITYGARPIAAPPISSLEFAEGPASLRSPSVKSVSRDSQRFSVFALTTLVSLWVASAAALVAVLFLLAH